MAAHRPPRAGDFAYSRISPTPHKKIELNSLIDSFPWSPSPIKGAVRVGNAGSALSAAASSSSDNLPSNQNREVNSNKERNRRSKSHDRRERNGPIKSVTAVEEGPATQPSPKSPATPPIEEHKDSKWVGIGFDGEALSLSVCSNSIDSSVVPASSTLRGQAIPKAIDFHSLASNDLPIVGEDEISTANADTFLQSRSVAQRVLHDVEELSVDLSLLEDVDSLASVLTREEARDLSKRLGDMETQLMELAGETHGKEDAIRALAKVTYQQERTVVALTKKARKQERKISTLTDLCQRLTARQREDTAAGAATRRETAALGEAGAATAAELRRSEARNAELTAALAAMTARRGRAEGESVQTSRLLLHSYADPRAGERDGEAAQARHWQAQCEELREEGRRNARRDGSTIQNLEAQLTARAKAHAKSKRRSASKIGILLEMKAAMEEQIRLLEGNDESSAD